MPSSATLTRASCRPGDSFFGIVLYGTAETNTASHTCPSLILVPKHHHDYSTPTYDLSGRAECSRKLGTVCISARFWEQAKLEATKPLPTWQKPRYVHEGDDGNIEGIAEAHEASPLHGRVDVQAA